MYIVHMELLISWDKFFPICVLKFTIFSINIPVTSLSILASSFSPKMLLHVLSVLVLESSLILFSHLPINISSYLEVFQKRILEKEIDWSPNSGGSIKKNLMGLFMNTDSRHTLDFGLRSIRIFTFIYRWITYECI